MATKKMEIPKPVPILDMDYDEWEACGDNLPYDWAAKAVDYRGPDDEDKPFTAGGEPTSRYDMSDQQAAEFMNEGKRRAR